MPTDSTRNFAAEKGFGLHYTPFHTVTHCIDLRFTRKILENSQSAVPVGKVGLIDADGRVVAGWGLVLAESLHGATPPTPPCVRVRTRRFDWVKHRQRRGVGGDPARELGR
jgi:hypothetical protein